ncbi:MAG: alpha/beta hydrolase [Micropruina sp.]|uniref:alpha/beta fold hydrolase n=1 Tax=Micropruina sp. TaxID=2737536 RepID=UPI0039E4110A
MRNPNQHLLPDGRRMAVHTASSGTGRVILLCHPTPCAGGFDPSPRLTAERGVTLISPDRAGYGFSEPRPENSWARVDTAADDLAHLLDHHNLSRVGVAGWGLGGWVACALAARRPELVERLCIFGAPMGGTDLSHLPDSVRAALGGLEAADPLEAARALTRPLEPYTDVVNQFAPLDFFGGVAIDQEAVAADLRPDGRIAAMSRAALRQGAGGFAAEVAGFHLRPWGFEPTEVMAKTLLLYGNKDPVVANRHAHWWHKCLPDSRAEMAPGAGALTIVRLWKRALSHLAPTR